MTTPRRAFAGMPRPLVFTNGVFDLLHRGHVECLTAARNLGSSLLVAVNSDDSVRRLCKGPGRPLNRLADRVFMLEALRCVDAVVIFDETKPHALLEIVRPDVYVKGGDYDLDRSEAARLVRSWGGTAVAIPTVRGYSTTGMITRIVALESQG